MHNLDRDRPTNKSVVQLDLCKALQGPAGRCGTAHSATAHCGTAGEAGSGCRVKASCNIVKLKIKHVNVVDTVFCFA